MLLWVFVAAGVIAVATLIGTLIGYLFKNITQKQNDAVIGFAAGVMLSAAVFGLIEPSLAFGGRFGVFVTVAGVFLGAVGVYGPLAEFAGNGALTPLTGFGYLISKGVREAIDEKGAIGILTGGLSATSAGITAAIFFSLIAAFIFKGKQK